MKTPGSKSDMVDIYGNEVSGFELVERAVRFHFDDTYFVLANVDKDQRIEEFTLDKMISVQRELLAQHDAFVSMLCDLYTPIVPAPARIHERDFEAYVRWGGFWPHLKLPLPPFKPEPIE